MKTNVLFCLVLPFCFGNAKAQDTLTIQDAGTVLVNVVESDSSELTYTLLETPDTSIYSLDRFNELSIECFDKDKNEPIELDLYDTLTSVIDWANRGRGDASQEYEGKNCGSFWVGFATAVTTPLVGWIPALVVSSVPPAEWNLGISKYHLRQNVVYYKAYRKEAHKVKKEVIWRSYREVTRVYGEVFLVLGNVINIIALL